MFKKALRALCESLFEFHCSFLNYAFTVLEQLAVLNVNQDNLELKINWEKSEKQPVDFENFLVGILFILPLFFSYMIFQFLNRLCLCFFFSFMICKIFPFFNSKLIKQMFCCYNHLSSLQIINIYFNLDLDNWDKRL